MNVNAGVAVPGVSREARNHWPWQLFVGKERYCGCSFPRGTGDANRNGAVLHEHSGEGYGKYETQIFGSISFDVGPPGIRSVGSGERSKRSIA
jgi:hypothetical protein